MYFVPLLLVAASAAEVRPVADSAPKFLYKVLSKEDWQASQNQKNLKLASADAAFIHFSTDEQLERITTKYWGTVPEYYVLKIDTEKLPGKMVFEVNPGGAAKYYHLYNGAIPREAVVEVSLKRT